MSFGKNVKVELLQQGKDQVALSEAVGIPYRSIQNMLKEGANPTLNNMLKISNFLKVPLSSLVKERDKFFGLAFTQEALDYKKNKQIVEEGGSEYAGLDMDSIDKIRELNALIKKLPSDKLQTVIDYIRFQLKEE